MKITCPREQLASAFQTAAGVASQRSPKEILKNVKLEAAGDTATLMATDLEIGIRIEVPGVEVESSGACLLPTDQFGKILRESSDEKLQLEANEKGTQVRGERSEFKLPGANPAEFPAVAVFEEEKFHELPARLLKELVRRTLFATDTESSRYALGGVLLEFEEKKITAVGTDGRRLAKMEGPAHAAAGHKGESQTIIPSRAMQLIDKALSDADAEIHIAARANDVLIKSPRATIYTRLVEGRFPKWRDVFPTRQDAVRIDVPVGPIYSAIRQAGIVTTKEVRGVDFTFGKGMLVLSGSTAEQGQSRVEMPIAYDGEEIVLTLDHSFVSDFFRVLDPEKNCTIEIENSETAALFSTDDGYAYVVMPLARNP